MWNSQRRRAADRQNLRYPSDLTDVEWLQIKSLVPPSRRGGRPRIISVREVINAILYVLSTECQWSALPKDLLPKSTAHYYFVLWKADGTLDRIHRALESDCDAAAPRETNSRRRHNGARKVRSADNDRRAKRTMR